MKSFLNRILTFKLGLLAKLYLWRYRPVIIAVTGNVGKTSTKEAITAVLSSIKKVRSGKGNLNNDLGVPLTIISDRMEEYYETGNSVWFWFKVIAIAPFGLFFNKNYPEVLVLEYGADRPGDIKKLARKFRPDVGVVTAVGEIPVHVEYFTSSEAVAREKAKLIEVLKPTGHAVLNFDDQTVLDMKKKTKAQVMTFGFGEEADIRMSDFDFRTDNEKPLGVTFKVNYDNTFVPVRIDGSLGKSQSWAAGAATVVGVIFKMNLVQISEALSRYKPPKGRLRILKGIKNSIIIDDTYNSSPAANRFALETLRDLPAKRRMAVLGDMLELGKYTIEAHQAAGNLAGSIVDVLVTVGFRGKFIADSAENQMDKQNIFSFPTSDPAKAKVQELVQEGDLILVKGSQGVRMEKVVEEIMAEPERKKELLVRQEKKWLNK